MKRKLLLCLSVCLLLSACGNSDSSSEKDPEATSAASGSTETTSKEEITSTTTKATTTAATTVETTTTTAVPEITDAEKYAKIVLDNEKVWFDSLDFTAPVDVDGFGIESTQIDCWFQDLDFDIIPEFIVGPVKISHGLVTSYEFNIFRINGNSLSQIWSKYEGYEDKYPYRSEHLYSSDGVKNAFIDSIYKDQNDKYHFIYEGFNTYEGTFAFNIVETSFGKEEITGKTLYLFDCFYLADENTYQINGKDVSMEELYSAVKSVTENSIGYQVQTKKIPLTDENTKETENCYGKMDKSQKLKALEESWDAYSLKSTNKSPELFVKMENMISPYVKRNEAINSVDWKKAFSDIVKTRGTNEKTAYQLIKLDNDDIPELLIDEPMVADKFPIYSYSNGKIITPDIDYTVNREVEYIEGSGRILISDYVGITSQTISIFEYKSGKFILLGTGTRFMNRIDYIEVFTWN